MLKFDFYESGKGETIIVTFPDGGIGVVDACPSPSKSRDAIAEITRDKRVHFICLTHPHADHGKDLVPLLKAGTKPDRVWITFSDVDLLLSSLKEADVAVPYKGLVRNYRNEQAKYFLEFVRLCYDGDFELFPIKEELRSFEFGPVKVHVIWPRNKVAQQHLAALRKFLKGEALKFDENELSAVLVFEYAGESVILGADALQQNWREAIRCFNSRNLPKAKAIKIPHHGAPNALDGEISRSYLSICREKPFAILFGGDSKHPHKDVYKVLQENTNLICLSNGLKLSEPDRNPLGIGILGAQAAKLSPVCRPHVSLSIDESARVEVSSGSCNFCTLP